MSLLDDIGGLPGVGGIIDFGKDIWSAKRASDEASFARDWSAGMRSTQYQTAVSDLRKAGLNPALAYMHGGAGNLSAAVGDVPSIGNPVSTAYQLKSVQADIDKVTQDTKVGKQVEALTNATQNKTDADTQFVLQSAMNKEKEGKLLDLQVPSARAEARFWESLGESGEGAKGLKFLVPLLRGIFSR